MDAARNCDLGWGYLDLAERSKRINSNIQEEEEVDA